VHQCKVHRRYGSGRRAIIPHVSTRPDAPDPDISNTVETCGRLGIEPVARERALGLIGEWSEANRAS